MTRARRRLAPALALVVAAAVFAGCAPQTNPDWKPVSWPVVGAVTSDVPASTDAAPQTIAMRIRNDDVHLDARWASLPGSQPINAVIEKAIRDAVGAQASAAGAAYHPQVFAAGAGLGDRGCAPGESTRTAADILGDRSGAVVVCEVTIARGAVFGETLRTVTGSGGTVASDTSQTFYTDLSTGAVGTDAQLFSDPSALWIASVDALRRHFGSLSLADVQAPTADQLAAFTAALGGTRFENGTVFVPVPADLTAPELDGLAQWNARGSDRPLYVAFTPDEIPTALGDLGKALAAASGTYRGPTSAGAGFEHMPCDLVPCMAMTLDDGPSAFTPTFLQALSDNQSAATFFELGQNAQRYPDTVRRVAAEGNEIGDHTWDHKYLTDLTDAEVTAELGNTRTLLQQLSGQSIPFFRPPGGFVDDHVIALAGQSAILWSVDTRDWSQPAASDLARYAIDTPQPGTIILMHDIQKVTEGVFPQVVAGLRDRGFVLVTVSALFNGSVPAGQVHHGPVY